MKKILYILLSVGLLACNSDSTSDSQDENKYQSTTPSSSSSDNNDDEETDAENKSKKFDDDTYSADVSYYNPKTGTQSSYTLDVEVEDNTVTVIHFDNQGWLDETHIVSGGELDEEGSTTIESDTDCEYTVTIHK